MPRWALVLSIGPVGAFIASGRRSRDLWWGSTWVSQCSWWVAKLLLDPPRELGAEVELLVPSPDRVREIGRRLRREGMAFGGRITNHIEAAVEADSSAAVAALAALCESRARRFLARQLRKCAVPSRKRERVRAALADVLDRDRFKDQVDAIEAGDFIEIFSAWSPVKGPFPAALERAWKLLDGRKAGRLFEAPAWTQPGRSKCDLDPGRDSVLKTANTRDRRVRGPVAARRHLARKILGIGPEEELDALGFGRRLALFRPGPQLGKLPFPPISRVAIDPWLHRAAADSRTAGAVLQLRAYLQRREVQDNPLFFSWCSPARDPETSWRPRGERTGAELFPFDTSFLFENGIQALLRELERIAARSGRKSEVAQARRDLQTLRPLVEHLHQIHGLPVPYYALLMMDGDGVGAALLAEQNLDRKRTLVAALDTFAERVEQTVRRNHGCAFYVGGDDLAAYLPLDRVLDAVEDLASLFEQVREAFQRQGEVTLSGGIALAHVKADLRAVRSCAQRGLAAAKRERHRAALAQGVREGWLAIYDLPRGGSERFAAGPREELTHDLREWLALLANEQLSLRSAHLLAELVARFSDVTDSGGNRGLELARYRVTAQSRRSFKKASPLLQERLKRIEESHWGEAARLAAELAIASRLLKAGRPRQGEPREEVAS